MEGSFFFHPFSFSLSFSCIPFSLSCCHEFSSQCFSFFACHCFPMWSFIGIGRMCWGSIRCRRCACVSSRKKEGQAQLHQPTLFFSGSFFRVNLTDCGLFSFRLFFISSSRNHKSKQTAHGEEPSAATAAAAAATTTATATGPAHTHIRHDTAAATAAAETPSRDGDNAAVDACGGGHPATTVPATAVPATAVPATSSSSSRGCGRGEDGADAGARAEGDY